MGARRGRARSAGSDGAPGSGVEVSERIPKLPDHLHGRPGSGGKTRGRLGAIRADDHQSRCGGPAGEYAEQMRLLLLAGVLAIAAQGHDITTQVTWSREISRLLVKHCAAC